jgi:ABC-type Mn2+/Zn2+ transport system ATPase subunit
MPPAITTSNLTKRFGAITAVDDVALEVAPGEVFGLIGPNGAGKTTLLQLLAALLDPTAGSAVVLGYDVRRDAEALRQRLGYVSQEFTLYSALSRESAPLRQPGGPQARGQCGRMGAQNSRLTACPGPAPKSRPPLPVASHWRPPPYPGTP